MDGQIMHHEPRRIPVPPGLGEGAVYVQGRDGEPGRWTDDSVAIPRLAAQGYELVEEEGGWVTIGGCAHAADVASLAGRVRSLELWVLQLLDNLADEDLADARYALKLFGRELREAGL